MFFRKGAAALALAACVTAAWSQATLRAEEIGEMLSMETLPNGAVTIVLEDHSSGAVTVSLRVRAGRCYEPDNLAGMSHYLEHLFYRGTTNRAPLQNRDEILNVGGLTAAGTWFDWTEYWNVVSKEHFKLALDGLADAFANLTIAGEHVEGERRLILDEVRQRAEEPTNFIFEELLRLSLSGHPLGGSVTGDAATVSVISREDIVKYYRNHYSPNNLVIVVAGAVGTDEAMAAVRESIGSLPVGEPHASPPMENRYSGLKERVIRQTGLNQSYFAAGFRTGGLTHPGRHAVEILSNILYCRFYQSAVEAEGVAGWVNVYPTLFEKAGIIVATAAPTSRENVLELKRILLNEILLIRTGGVSETEFKRMVECLRRRHALDRENLQARASALGEAQLLGNVRYATDYVESLQRATLDDVNAAAKLFLTKENFCSVIAVPEDMRLEGGASEEHCTELLAAIGAGTETPQGLDFGATLYPPEPAPVLRGSGASGGEPSLVRVRTKVTLENGLRLVHQRRKGWPIVSVSILLRAGSYYDPPGKEGLACLTLRSLTAGTPTRTKADIFKLEQELGWGFDSDISRDSAGLRLSVLRDDLPAAIEMCADTLMRPEFPEDELEKEKLTLQSELAEAEDYISTSAFRRFHAAVFGPHPYGKPAKGTVQGVRAVSRGDVGDFFAKRYGPGNCVVVFVGDVPFDEACALTRKLFGGWSAKAGRAPEPVFEGGMPPPCSKDFPTGKGEGYVVIGGHGPAFTSPDYPAVSFLSRMLALRAFRQLVYGKSLSYTASCWAVGFENDGYIAGYVSAGKDGMPAAETAMRKLLAEAFEAAPSEQEVRNTIGYMIGGKAVSEQNTGDIAEGLGLHELLGGGYENYERYFDTIRRMTPEKSYSAAAKYLRPESLSSVKLVPR
jgi:zinc protease